MSKHGRHHVDTPTTLPELSTPIQPRWSENSSEIYNLILTQFSFITCLVSLLSFSLLTFHYLTFTGCSCSRLFGGGAGLLAHPDIKV